ncbi:nucleotidyltransferase family protein [Peribacillus frigoritolerans]|nr:nucleotidyltransferase family protein [Peribacillus frigoritolerans]
MGKEDLFLYLIAHGSKHGWFRLRWLADIDLLMRKFSGVEKSNLQITKYQQQHFRGTSKALCRTKHLFSASQLLNTPINKEMQAYTEKKTF